LGMYTSPGPKSCAGFEGSYGHEEQDARTFAEWGVDYLKYDWCSAGLIYDDAEMPAVYLKMAEALEWSGLPMSRNEHVVELGCAPGGASQAFHRPLALRLFARNGYEDSGMAEIGGYPDVGDCDQSHSWVPDFAAKQGVGNYLPHGLGYLIGSTRRRAPRLHRYTVTVSTMRTPSASSTMRSAERSVSSTTSRALPTAAHAISARCHRS